jgi:hypothetical protein
MQRSEASAKLFSADRATSSARGGNPPAPTPRGPAESLLRKRPCPGGGSLRRLGPVTRPPPPSPRHRRATHAPCRAVGEPGPRGRSVRRPPARFVSPPGESASRARWPRFRGQRLPAPGRPNNCGWPARGGTGGGGCRPQRVGGRLQRERAELRLAERRAGGVDAQGGVALVGAAAALAQLGAGVLAEEHELLPVELDAAGVRGEDARRHPARELRRDNVREGQSRVERPLPPRRCLACERRRSWSTREAPGI